MTDHRSRSYGAFNHARISRQPSGGCCPTVGVDRIAGAVTATVEYPASPLVRLGPELAEAGAEADLTQILSMG